ncbi:hypothetical protein [Streptomyces sp. NPDC101115]|uniref:hypothetical protein n=1 Tax=Streptomyces sp. NPDC101115 TaxID=3366106 RepID=UPI00381321D6
MSEWTDDPDLDEDDADQPLTGYVMGNPYAHLDDDLDDPPLEGDDVDDLIDLGAAEYFDDEPEKICGEYFRPATRRPVRLNRRRSIVDLPGL